MEDNSWGWEGLLGFWSVNNEINKNLTKLRIKLYSPVVDTEVYVILTTVDVQLTYGWESTMA